MARRLDIELTSARPDGTWTWRAAGALEPRGSLDASLLYPGAKAGDVVRAETESGIDGISVLAVEPPRPPAAEDKNRIELLERPLAAAVTSQLAGRGLREGRPGRERPSHARPGARPPSSPPLTRGSGPERVGAGPGLSTQGRDNVAGDRSVGARPGGDRPRRGAPGGRARAGAQGGGPEGRASRGTGGDAKNDAWQRRPARSDSRAGVPEPRARSSQSREVGPARQHRLNPGNTHRNAMLESLPPEQRPIAQQLLRGGIPAVRTALFFERERAREEGRPEPSTEGVIAIAESLVTKVKAAEWRDRAEAAMAAGPSLATRDLRALVNGSDVARDESSREMVIALREMLERRVEANRQAWSEEVTRHLDQGQVARALKLSARPPDPTARFSAELAVRLRDAAGAALSPELSPERWLALLTAVSESPVRRTVKPHGLPPNPTPELLEAARRQCGRVPGLAPLLGISVPPPPGPLRPNIAVTAHARRQSRPPKPPRPPARGNQPSSAGGEAAQRGPSASVADQHVDEIDEQSASASPAHEQSAPAQAGDVAALNGTGASQTS